MWISWVRAEGRRALAIKIPSALSQLDSRVHESEFVPLFQVLLVRADPNS